MESCCSNTAGRGKDKHDAALRNFLREEERAKPSLLLLTFFIFSQVIGAKTHVASETELKFGRHAKPHMERIKLKHKIYESGRLKKF